MATLSSVPLWQGRSRGSIGLWIKLAPAVCSVRADWFGSERVVCPEQEETQLTVHAPV